MKSSIYQLVDGHLYYSNHCIKVRYDLLRRNDIQELTEDEVFDYFQNILNLEKIGKRSENLGGVQTENVRSMMPLCSQKAHRFIYMTDNVAMLKPNKLIITPFLHERKIFHHIMNEQDECFYNVQRRRDLKQDLFQVLILN